MAYNITSLGDAATNANFTVKIGTTALSALTTTFESTTGFTTVFPAQTYTHTATGIQTINFTTPFVWDGTSNIIIEVTHNGANATNNSITYFTATAGNTVVVATSTTAATGVTSTQRLNLILGQVITYPISNMTWSNGISTVGTTPNLTLTPAQTANYSATCQVNGCSLTSNSLSVTVNPLPSAPSATNSSQCGAINPTATVSSTSTYTTPTFNWYAGSTGVITLQSSTSNTYNSPVASTTSFYVSEVDVLTGCESTPRTQVDVTVTNPALITVTPGATASICLGTSTILDASSAASPAYTYTWTANNYTTSGMTGALTGANQSITPTQVGSFIYTVTGTNGICTDIKTVTLTVNNLPNITTSTASPLNTCSGGDINLAATIQGVTAGTANIGSGATTGTDYAAIFYHLWGGNKTQHLITAAELSAAGLSAGNITNLAIDIATGGGTYAGLGISMAHTSNTNMAAGFDNTATFVPVYASPSYTTLTGVNNYSLSTPFNWDGTSNIIIQFCWSNNNGGGTSNYAKIDNTTYVSTAYFRADDQLPAAICSNTSITGTYSKRPKFTFGGQVATDVSTTLNWNWMPGNINDVTGIYNITNTGTSPISEEFIVTAINPLTGCYDSDTASVSVYPIPQAPTANNTTVCGIQNATCSVNGSGTAGNSFLWYTSSTGGTALTGQTGSQLINYPISTTTNFYVSEFNGNCESPRTNVTVTFVTAPSISLSTNTLSICSGLTSNAVTISSGASDYDTYSWTPSAGVSGNAASGWTFTNTATTTYNLSVSQSAALLCSNATSLIVNTIPLPTSISINPSAPSLCPGGMQTLVATGGGFVNTILSETFESPNSWTITNTSTGGTPANAEWTLRPSGYVYSSTAYNSNDLSQFYMANSDAQGSGGITNSNLTSPAFSTLNYSSGTINYYTYYRHDLNSFVEYSLDGINWMSVQTLSATIGSASNFVLQTVNLPSQALNQQTVYIRFQYNGNYGWYWAVDNVSITGNRNNITWSPTTNLYLDAAGTQPYSGQEASTVYSMPSNTSTYTATSTNSVGCINSQNVTVTVLPGYLYRITTSRYHIFCFSFWRK
jgi:hypothetical protein